MNKDYIASEYRRMHDDGKFSGASLRPYLSEIDKLIKEYNIVTLLDYGCGKASIHNRHKLAKEVCLYDPYYAPYSVKPTGTFDMVICTDVLEHVPEDEVGKVIHDLINYTDKVLFVSISTKKAKKTFGNGENVHVTIRPKEWWEDMLKNAKGIEIVSHYD